MEIEFLALANHAEAVNGLLYLTGVGWNEVSVNAPADQPILHHFGIGVSILVGWNDTNRPIPVELRLEGEDGQPELAKVEGEVNVGRAPTVKPGSDQRAVLALNINTQFPARGGYRVVCRVNRDDQKMRSYSFVVK